MAMPGKLSGRELEILKWVALGKSDHVIAHLFGITEEDVSRNIYDISIELNASDRVDAGLKAIKQGLV